MKMIAEKAGVNWATVSRALNPSTASLISDEVRKRILKISDELGYRPSYSGRSIVTGKNFKIGMILGNMQRDFAAIDWARIICGLSAEIQKSGYVLCLLYANGSEDMDAQVINFLMSGVADGYVTGPSMIGKNVQTMLNKVNAPVWVVCESGISIANVNHIQRDDTDAFCEVWRKIPKKWLKKILYYSRTSNERLNRLEEIKRTGKIVYPHGDYLLQSLFVPNRDFQLSEYRTNFRFCMDHLSDLKRYKFIWCDSDIGARAVCDALKSVRLQPGVDFSVVGYGDFETYSGLIENPEISTISAEALEIGAALGRNILDQIAGKREKQTVVKSRFIARKTFPAE